MNFKEAKETIIEMYVEYGDSLAELHKFVADNGSNLLPYESTQLHEYINTMAKKDYKYIKHSNENV